MTDETPNDPTDIEFLAKVAEFWKRKKPTGGNSRFGRFIIQRTLGQGGFGVVYLAYDPMLDRQVAIKVPGLQSLANESRLKRFLAEARHLGSMSNPNIAEIYDANEVDGLCYIAMKYYAEGTLSNWLQKQSFPIPSKTIEHIFEGIVNGVAAAHSAGLMHRDLKPSNILIETDISSGTITPFVTDFGLAKNQFHGGESETATPLSRLGTAGYMAPELWNSQDTATRASDVFSLGTILFELMLGRLPTIYDLQVNSSPGVTTKSLVNEDRSLSEIENLTDVRPDIPRRLIQVCKCCLMQKPSDRFSDANELLKELQEVHLDYPTGPGLASERRTVQTKLGLGALVALLAILGGAAVSWLPIKSKPAQLGNEVLAIPSAPGRGDAGRTYAFEIQNIFERIRTDSMKSRQKAVELALVHGNFKHPTFEVAYLLSANDRIRDFSLRLADHYYYCHVQVSPNRGWLAVNGQRQDIVLFDFESNRQVRRFGGLNNGAITFAFSPDNKFLLGIASKYGKSGAAKPDVVVWRIDTTDQSISLSEQMGLLEATTCAFVSPDELMISGEFTEGKRIKVYTLTDRTEKRSEAMYPLDESNQLLEENYAYQIYQTNKVDGRSPSLHVVDKARASTHSFPLRHASQSTDLSANGLVAVVDSPVSNELVENPRLDKIEQSVVVWNLVTQTQVFREDQVETTPIGAITISPDEKSILYVDALGIVHERGLVSQSLQRIDAAMSPSEIWSVDFHPNDSRVLLAGDNGFVAIKDFETGSYTQWPLHGEMLVTHCRWRPNHPEQFATTSFDKNVRLWSLRNGSPELLGEFPHPNKVRCLAFSSNGAKLATGCDDQGVRVFDIDSMQLETSLFKHKDKIRSLVYAKNSNTLFSCLALRWLEVR